MTWLSLRSFVQFCPESTGLSEALGVIRMLTCLTTSDGGRRGNGGTLNRVEEASGKSHKNLQSKDRSTRFRHNLRLATRIRAHCTACGGLFDAAFTRAAIF